MKEFLLIQEGFVLEIMNSNSQYEIERRQRLKAKLTGNYYIIGYKEDDIYEIGESVSLDEVRIYNKSEESILKRDITQATKYFCASRLEPKYVYEVELKVTKVRSARTLEEINLVKNKEAPPENNEEDDLDGI